MIKSNPICKSGFTLIEVLIVMVLLGIVVAMAIPNFGVLAATSNVKGATQTLAMDLNLSKMRAISQSKKCRLLFLNGTSYKIQYYDPAGSIWKDLPGEVTRNFSAPSNPYFHEGVNITAPAGNEVVFQPWGSATAASIEVKNSEKKGTITLSSTGKICTEVCAL